MASLNLLNIFLVLAAIKFTAAVLLEELYSFGQNVDDSKLSQVDDGYVGVSLSSDFAFFDSRYSTIFVHNNGIISSPYHYVSFNPEVFPIPTFVIAPFWADVDTRRNGQVWYKEHSRNSDNFEKARENVMKYFCLDQFEPTIVFTITWDRVPYFSLGSKTNTFQSVLVSDGIQSFAIFLYADGLIEWTTGDSSGGTNGLGGNAAHVGYNAGGGGSFENVPGSGTASIINITRTSNVGVNGIWAFQLNDKESQCTKYVTFKLILKLNESCQRMITRLNNITTEMAITIARELMQLCNCTYVPDTAFTKAKFVCIPELPSFLAYQGLLQGNIKLPTDRLLAYLVQWAMSGSVVYVSGHQLVVQSSCPVNGSIKAIECINSSDGSIPMQYNIMTTEPGMEYTWNRGSYYTQKESLLSLISSNNQVGILHTAYSIGICSLTILFAITVLIFLIIRKNELKKKSSSNQCPDIASENGKFNASSLDYDENYYEDMDCNVKLEKSQCTEVTLESSLCDQDYSQNSGIYEEIH